MIRLKLSDYKQLESYFARPFVGHQTTPTQAAYLCGVADVLHVIRQGLIPG